MSRRRKAQAFIEQAHTQFLNENAPSYKTNGKIETTDYLRPINVHQKQLVKSIKNNILTVGSGLAGCGKTVMALHTAVELLNNPESPIKKIYYVRANIDDRDEQDIGALPGDLIEKMRMLAYPILDNLELFVKKESIDFALETGKIEVLPFQFMRGRSFHNSFVLLDEAQNAKPKQLKTLLTRICEDSKLVILGDSTQCDIELYHNGLVDLEWRLNKKLNQIKNTENQYQTNINFGVVHFDYEDIVRSELTKFIIDLYDLK